MLDVVIQHTTDQSQRSINWIRNGSLKLWFPNCMSDNVYLSMSDIDWIVSDQISNCEFRSQSARCKIQNASSFVQSSGTPCCITSCKALGLGLGFGLELGIGLEIWDWSWTWSDLRLDLGFGFGFWLEIGIWDWDWDGIWDWSWDWVWGWDWVWVCGLGLGLGLSLRLGLWFGFGIEWVCGLGLRLGFDLSLGLGFGIEFGFVIEVWSLLFISHFSLEMMFHDRFHRD